MTINPQRAQALFLAALEISDSVARRELLERECVNDAALRQRVEDLLAAHAAIGGFDAAPSNTAINATINTPATLNPVPWSQAATSYSKRSAKEAWDLSG